jgi:hypothetical protein
MRAEFLQLARSTWGVSDQCLLSTAMSGEIAPDAPAQSVFWSWTVPSNFPTDFPLVLERLRLQFTTITAFTTPVVADRALAFGLLDGTPSTGSATLRTQLGKAGLSQFGVFNGTVRMAQTAPLALSGDPPAIADSIGVALLAGYGASGATFDRTWRWDGSETSMISLLPGAVVCLYTPFGMDPGGTFVVAVEADIQGLPDNYPVP